jgi:alcohol dehydrogenase class IV
LPCDTVEEGTESLIAAVCELDESMGIPTRIRDLKIDEAAFRENIETMSKNVLEDLCTEGNPRRPSRSDVRLLLEQAW